MIGACLIILTLAGASRTSADGFDDALALAARGEFVEAVRAAETVEDPLRRAQALVWTYQQAGDWVGADRLARAELEDHPKDLWLLERRVSIALTLGRSDLAPARLEAWERALSDSTLPPAELAAGKERFTASRAKSLEMQEVRDRRDQGVRRAQQLTLAAGLGFALATALLLRTASRGTPSQA